jgi:hypothetical protein
MPTLPGVGSAAEVNPRAQALFDLARQELTWLLADGYAETRGEIQGSSVELDYGSAHGVVLIGVHLFKSEFAVRLGPPGAGWLSGGLIDLLTVLRTIGLNVPSVYPPDRASEEQLREFFMGYLDGLKALRHHELAGDWSRFDRARDEASDRAWRRGVGLEPAE